MIKIQAMRVKINYDSKNQTIERVSRHNFETCASKQADKGEKENITTLDKNM
jgi:hypothetical protein